MSLICHTISTSVGQLVVNFSVYLVSLYFFMSKYRNGFITNSSEIHESENPVLEKSQDELKRIFRGFQKVPLVICQRYDIKPYLNKMGLDLPPDLKKSSSVEAESILKQLSLSECSVSLKKENLNHLKEVFMNNSKKIHFNDTNPPCNIPQKKTSENEFLNQQENKHMICYKPENKIRKRVSFSDKIIIHEMKEYHKCRKCSKIFDDNNSLTGHMKQSHKKSTCYKCFYCSKDFIDRSIFKVHIKLHCDACGLLLPNKKHYLEHRRIICKTIKKYECKTCYISLFHFMDLKDHSYEHLGTYFICDICKDRFESKCAIAHHIKFLHSKRRPKSLFSNHTIGVNRVYTCNFCDENSFDRELIEKHVSSFPNYKKCAMTGYRDFYFCDQCFGKFSTETDMLRHKWSHFLKTTNEDSNDLQSKSVSLKTTYNVNEKLPSSLQPNLVLEKLILPEPDVESLLNLVNVTNFDLGMLKKPIVNPVRRKTIISRHQCEICGKYFSSNYCLVRHTNSIHGMRNGTHSIDDVRCENCEEIFALPSLLQSHNCLRMTIPDMPYYEMGPDLQYENIYEAHHQNRFDDLTIDDDDDYMNAVDFEIPAPIVELTEYENLNIVVNGSNGQLDVRENTNKQRLLNGLQYVVVMQEVPIEF